MTIRRAAAVLIACAVTTSAACAPLPADSNPRAIDRDRVPDLFPAPTTTVPPSPASGAVCFVAQTTGSDNSDSECIDVNLEDVSPRTLIDALAAGPDEHQKTRGLTSLVPRDTRLLGAEPAADDPSVLVIDLSSEINSLFSPNNIVAYRQIVETLTNGINGLGVDAIRVKVDGKSTKIPTDKGQLTTADPDDFATPGFGSGSSTSRG